MRARSILSVARAFFAGLTVLAVGFQFVSLAQLGTLNPVNYFSYFTIESNVIAVVSLLVALAAGAGRGPGVDRLRGAAVVYMCVTGVVYALLLRDTDVDTAIVWVNAVVHQVMPVVLVLDWLLDPPAARLRMRDALWWLAYPVAWIAYTMLRGPIAGWYPYPFLDPGPGGYAPVLVTIAVVFVAGAVLCLLVAWVGNVLRGRGVTRGASFSR